jgi:hypothetical protein
MLRCAIALFIRHLLPLRLATPHHPPPTRCNRRSSERNISAVVKGSDSTRSLRAVHAAFLLSNQASMPPPYTHGCTQAWLRPT